MARLAGDSQMRYFEVTDEEPYVHYISTYSSKCAAPTAPHLLYLYLYLSTSIAYAVCKPPSHQ